MRRIAKSLAKILFLVMALPLAAVSGFGRIPALFELCAQFCALIPGLPGNYLRIAYYYLTLLECDLSSCVSFGSFFAHSQARLGANVYIGSYCIFGKTSIGNRCQIASGVQILSGSRQHARDSEGRILGAEQGVFAPIKIGQDCWLGAGSIIMADIGPCSTIGAGSVVTKPIPAGVTAVGSPAKVLSR